jgi:hypothetical protein
VALVIVQSGLPLTSFFSWSMCCFRAGFLPLILIALNTSVTYFVNGSDSGGVLHPGIQASRHPGIQASRHPGTPGNEVCYGRGLDSFISSEVTLTAAYWFHSEKDIRFHGFNTGPGVTGMILVSFHGARFIRRALPGPQRKKNAIEMRL